MLLPSRGLATSLIRQSVPLGAEVPPRESMLSERVSEAVSHGGPMGTPADRRSLGASMRTDPWGWSSSLPRFEGLPTASSQTVPMDGCFFPILSLRDRVTTRTGPTTSPRRTPPRPHTPVLERNQLPASHSPITHGKGQGRQQAMRAILLIPAAVAVILALVYFVARRDDEDDDDRGSAIVLVGLLSWW